MSDGPRVSVVVASHNARTSVAECLGVLLDQRPGDGLELVVVDNSTDGTTQILRERFPDVRLVTRPPSALIPELWGTGIEESRAPIVAITTAHCVPDRNWLPELLKAHEAPAAAIGGAIENEPSGGLVDWAVYFCRYSRYMLPCREGVVEEIAGDNASYKRAAIDQCRVAWRHGFWEPAVHAALKKEGAKLLLVPSIVVTHRRSFRVREFMRQRFRHGMQFGKERVSRFGGGKRALYAALSPAIPLVFLVRIARQVLIRRRHHTKFLLSLPILVLFLLAWTAGELTGTLRVHPGSAK